VVNSQLQVSLDKSNKKNGESLSQKQAKIFIRNVKKLMVNSLIFK
jgi:hypothetical protein